MATSVLRHHEDDGVLSVFASDAGELLFACEKGHWWIVEAAKSGSSAPTDELADDAGVDAGMPIRELVQRFGPRSLKALHPE